MDSIPLSQLRCEICFGESRMFLRSETEIPYVRCGWCDSTFYQIMGHEIAEQNIDNFIKEHY